MRMWILTFLLLALAKSISGCKCHMSHRFPCARNEIIFGEPIEPTLIDALRGSKKK